MTRVFINVTEKIEEKLKLFKNSEIFIYCADQEAVKIAIEKTGIKTFSWGVKTNADVKISLQGNICYVSYDQQHHTVQLPFSDKASIENCMHCLSLMLYLGYSFKKIQQGINSLRSVPMRMEMKEGINQCYLIDDTYNNDLGGLEISIQFLTHQNQKKKKRLILSDILESGLTDELLVQKILDLLEKNNIPNFVGIGPVLAKHQSLFPSTSIFFKTTEDFLNQFDFESIYQEVILVKGARTFAFEKIVNRLQRKVHGTVMEIDLGALVQQLEFFQVKIKTNNQNNGDG